MKKNIQSKIENNKTKDALNLLSKYINETRKDKYLSQVTILHSNIKQLNEDKNTGQINNEDYGLRLARINHAILKLSDEVFQEKTTNQNGKTVWSNQRKTIVSISIGSLLVLIVWGFLQITRTGDNPINADSAQNLFNDSLTNVNTLITSSDSVKNSNALSQKIATEKSDLAIVDVGYFIDSMGRETNKIDLKLRNRGKEIIFLKKANFKVTNKWYFEPYSVLCQQSAYYPTENYDVKFTNSISNNEIVLNLSQVIKPNDVDRFTFELGEIGLSAGYHIYAFYIELLYNEQGLKLKTEEMLVYFLSNDEGRCSTPLINDDIYSKVNKNQQMEVDSTSIGMFGRTLKSNQDLIEQYSKNYTYLQELKNNNSIKSKSLNKFINRMQREFKTVP